MQHNSRSTNTLPFHLLFGIHIKVRENVEIRRLIEDEWITTFQEEREGIRTRAREKIDEIQAQNRK